MQQKVFNIVSGFVYGYPLTMSLLWVAGSLLFEFFRRLDGIQELILQDILRLDTEDAKTRDLSPDDKLPPVSIIVPCHNESETITETVEGLLKLNLGTFEIILVNDCSRDNTLEIMVALQEKHAGAPIRIVNLTTNQGKGCGMTMGAAVARHEFVMGIDADAVLEPDCIRHLLWHMKNDTDVGAVTGNPKIRNRTNITAKVQVGEFASIIGMIKRTQRLLGVVYCASGVVTLFRKRALLEAGFWSNDMITEDIDVSWKIQLLGWNLPYEPDAVCWILMPETIKGVFNQRFRWAQGGNEVLLKYWKKMFDWRNLRMLPLYAEYATALVWCHCFFLLGIWAILDVLADNHLDHEYNPNTAILLCLATLVQFSIGLFLDRKHDRNLHRVVAYLVLYPIYYWTTNTVCTVSSFPKALMKKRGQAAVWVSPDRGLRKDGTLVGNNPGISQDAR